MSTGSLLLPLGYAPLHPTTGALVPNGKLHFYRTGTTTDQDTYSDSTLLSANANPVVLSAAGLLETKVYGNPSSGFDYRVRLYTSADVLLTTWDDVKVVQSDVATIQEGSFTGTLTGYASPPTGTVSYRIVSNIGGTGKLCTLYISSAITGTSNTTAMTMTGVPSACQPTGNRTPVCVVSDNTTNVMAIAAMTSGSGTITFSIDAPFDAAGFTNTNTKGLPVGWTISYAL